MAPFTRAIKACAYEAQKDILKYLKGQRNVYDGRDPNRFIT